MDSIKQGFLIVALLCLGLANAKQGEDRDRDDRPQPTPTMTPTPVPTVTPRATPVPPPQASAAGLNKLSFDEECNGPLDIGFGTPGHKWNAGLWWEPVPPASDFVVSGGVLTITATATSNTDLCTQYHDASGGTYFHGGYFEARIMATDWSAFWLYCADRPFVYGNLVLPSDPMTWTNEIDIMETDPGYPNTVFCTLHRNTSSDGGVPDAQNNPDFFPMPGGGSVFNQWHTYGVLWTQSTVTWYVDNVQVASVPSYPSTWQPVQLVISAQPNGVNGGASNVLPPITQVQWVRVWTSTMSTYTKAPKLRSYVDHKPHSTADYKKKYGRTFDTYWGHWPVDQSDIVFKPNRAYINSYIDHLARPGDLAEM